MFIASTAFAVNAACVSFNWFALFNIVEIPTSDSANDTNTSIGFAVMFPDFISSSNGLTAFMTDSAVVPFLSPFGISTVGEPCRIGSVIFPVSTLATLFCSGWTLTLWRAQSTVIFSGLIRLLIESPATNWETRELFVVNDPPVANFGRDLAASISPCSNPSTNIAAPVPTIGIAPSNLGNRFRSAVASMFDVLNPLLTTNTGWSFAVSISAIFPRSSGYIFDSMNFFTYGATCSLDPGLVKSNS